MDRLVAIYSSGMSSNNATYGDVIARAGRAARVGTRAGRIVRLVKLLQVFSAINPEEWCASEERKEELRRLAAEAKAKAKEKRVQASRLGKILAEQTTRRVIVAVLCMMIILPFLTTEEQALGPVFGLSLLFLNRSPCATAHDYLTLPP